MHPRLNCIALDYVDVWISKWFWGGKNRKKRHSGYLQEYFWCLQISYLGRKRKVRFFLASPGDCYLLVELHLILHYSNCSLNVIPGLITLFEIPVIIVSDLGIDLRQLWLALE